MKNTLADHWIKHYETDSEMLTISHDDGQLTLPVSEISSHKHTSYAELTVRLFSGQRHTLSLRRFRVDEIDSLLHLLKSVEANNRKKANA